MQLSAELWASVAQHLKPRHMFKLMRVCKLMNKAVDTELYWSRVAIHILMRNDEAMELGADVFEALNPKQLQAAPSGLFYLANYDTGYYQGMQAFIIRVRQCLALPTQDPKRLDFWKFASQPLSAVVHRYQKYHDQESEQTMKQIATREYGKRQPEYGYSKRSKMLESEKAMALFVTIMEDVDMPAKHKRIWGTALHELLETLASRVNDPAELYALSDRMESFD